MMLDASSMFTKMLLGYECQELTVFRQLGNFASVYFSCTTTYTAGLLYFTTVLANEFVQQITKVQNKKTEIIMYYKFRYYNGSCLFPGGAIRRVRN